MKIGNIIFVLIVVAMLCGSASAVVITDYGNGVVFFNGYPEQFGSDLSKYLTDHPQQRVVSIAAFDYGACGYTSGYTSGYYVVFENKTTYLTCHPEPRSYRGDLMAFNYTCVSV